MEKRKRERLPVRRTEDQRAYQDFPYEVINVSKSGCAVESQCSLGNVHSRIDFDLPLPGKVDRLKLIARVVWQEMAPGHEAQAACLYGLQFSAMDESSELILDLYLDYLRREVHLARLDEAWRKLQLAQERISVLLACEEKKTVHFLH